MADRTVRLVRASVDMVAEAGRALEKHGPANTMDAPGKTDGDRLAILMEEVGEVAHELTYDQGGDIIVGIPGFRGANEVNWESWSNGENYVSTGTTRLQVETATAEELAKLGYQRLTRKDRLRKELVQVGAMAATWIAFIDSEENA